MPHQEYEIGDVLVYDGTNTDEIAEATKTETPLEPTPSGSITVLVPMPFGGVQEVTMSPGDGLVHRPGMGNAYLPITADSLASFSKVEQPKAAPARSAKAKEPAK
jgi:hypothetical protein